MFMWKWAMGLPVHGWTASRGNGAGNNRSGALSRFKPLPSHPLIRWRRRLSVDASDDIGGGIRWAPIGRRPRTRISHH